MVGDQGVLRYGTRHHRRCGPRPTLYPFTLLFPQARTEEVLEERALGLGVRILRGHTVTGAAQDGTSVSVEVTGPDGPYEARAEYLVGCDGAGSAVRRASGVAFPGTDSTVFGFLGDVILDDPPALGYTRNGASGALMIVPLPGGLHRFVGVDPAVQDVVGKELSFEEFRSTAIRIAGVDFGMRDPVWLSRFGNSTRQAADYRTGRVLLAGDAAHLHFPTGGVGLNVGVQDATSAGSWPRTSRAEGPRTCSTATTASGTRSAPHCWREASRRPR